MFAVVCLLLSVSIMEALANLGIDGKLLLAQAINFLVLLFILRRFAYRPMLAFLEKRTERIEQGLQDAKKAKDDLLQVAKQEKEILAHARQEAKLLIETAEISAKKRDAERLVATEEEAKRFLEGARLTIEEEKVKMVAEAKKEIAEVVTLSVEKILKEHIDRGK